MKTIVVALILFMISWSANSNEKYSKFSDGSCSGNHQTLHCYKFNSKLFVNGRSMFIFFRQGMHPIAFSGERDEQPTPKHYILYVDRVWVDDTVPIPVSGWCDFHFNDEAGTSINRIKCKANNSTTVTHLKFRGKGFIY